MLVISFFMSPPAWTGGDYWLIKVEDKITTDVPQKLKFEFSLPARGILQGCKQITVLLEYQRVPAWSWLHFIDSSHPTKDETTIAVEFLNNKFAKSAQAYFGYIGGGFSKYLRLTVHLKARDLS